MGGTFREPYIQRGPRGTPALQTWHHCQVAPCPLWAGCPLLSDPRTLGAPCEPSQRRPRPPRQAEGRKINKQGLMAAVIMAVIMAFIWLPNESHHRQREKLSIAQALMNFFANCNQARPSQLAD